SDPTVLVIRPATLSEDAVKAMVVYEYGREPQAEFAAACHSATGGNPLFVRALVAALHGEGVEPIAANARRAHQIGPEPVARAVALRLSRLPEEARRFATATAVLGDGAYGRVLAPGGARRRVRLDRAGAAPSRASASSGAARGRGRRARTGGRAPRRGAACRRPLCGGHAARGRRPGARSGRAGGRGPPPAARAGRAPGCGDAGRHAGRAGPRGAARGRPRRRR